VPSLLVLLVFATLGGEEEVIAGALPVEVVFTLVVVEFFPVYCACWFAMGVREVSTPVTLTLLCDIKLGSLVHENLAVILSCPCLILVYAGVRVKFHFE
jgi:hypothetical protein